MITRDGLTYRPEDKIIVQESERCYGSIPVTSDDIVLDLGAHIGTASRMLLRKGAKHSIAIEADPRNVPLLRKNLHRLPATICWAAVGPVNGRTDFYPASKGHLSSLLGDDRRRSLRVPMIAFGDLLSAYQPTIVKCDIEFGEYELGDLMFLPDHVRVLAMEIHIRYVGIFESRPQTLDDIRIQRRAASELVGAIERQGFTTLRRKDKVAKPDQPPALPDDTWLPPMTKAIDAVWVR